MKSLPFVNSDSRIQRTFEKTIDFRIKIDISLKSVVDKFSKKQNFQFYKIWRLDFYTQWSKKFLIKKVNERKTEHKIGISEDHNLSNVLHKP